MLGVKFGDKHSFYDLGLWMTGYPQISPPAPKIRMVDVPGMDGALDMTKVLTGYTQYNRRTMQLEFAIMAPRLAWPDVHSDVMDALHGQEMSIILDDDPDFCYTGVLSVSGFDPQKVTSGVTITADLSPYKTRIAMTKRSFTVSGSLTATITTMHMPTVPTITASTAMTMTFGGKTYSLKAGENTFDDLILRRNQKNTFTFAGSGTVTLTYKEGRF